MNGTSTCGWTALFAGILLSACDTVSPGLLLEVTARDDPPEEAAAGTVVYGGGLALAINRTCDSAEAADLDRFDVLCQKASVLRLDDSGALRWTYTVNGPVRITSLVEAAPGLLVVAGLRKVGSAQTMGFVEAVRDGGSVWVHEWALDSAVRSVAVGLDGVWVAGRSGALGFFEVLDPGSGGKRGEWVLDDQGAPPEQRVVESVATALIPAPERGVYAAGTLLRVGGARDVWVARLVATNKPAKEDVFSEHLGSPGFHDEPGAFALLSGGLFLAVRDMNPDLDRVTFYRWDPTQIASGPTATLVMDNAKYRWIRAEGDGSGGAVLAGAWRPTEKGAFMPTVLRVDPDGNPDAAWKVGTEWGLRVRNEEGRAIFVVAGSGGNPLVGGWFVEQGKPVGFLKRID